MADKASNHQYLQITISTLTVPHQISAPVEFMISNKNNMDIHDVNLNVHEDTGFTAAQYSISLPIVKANSICFQTCNIVANDQSKITIRGRLAFKDDSGSSQHINFESILRVTDPADFPTFNSPYITGPQVRDARMFFGRRDNIRTIIQIVDGPVQSRHVILYGRWRVGKSSILEQLKSRSSDGLEIQELWRLQRSYYQVGIDFQSLQPRAAPWRIFHHIYDSIWQALRDYVPNLDVITALQFSQSQTPDGLFINFIRTLVQKLKQQDRKLLLMMDEFHVLLEIVGQNDPIISRLHEIGNFDRIAFIFAGPMQIRRLLERKAPRILDVCDTPILVGRLSESEARDLIVNPMKVNASSFTWSEEAVSYLVDLSDGYPWCIQMVCHRVVVRLIEGKRLHVTWSDIQEAVMFLDHFHHFDSVIERELDDLSINNSVVLSAMVHLLRRSEDDHWVSQANIQQVIAEMSPRFDMALVQPALNFLCDQQFIAVDPSNSQHFRMRELFVYLYLKRKSNLPDDLRKGGFK